MKKCKNCGKDLEDDDVNFFIKFLNQPFVTDETACSR